MNGQSVQKRILKGKEKRKKTQDMVQYMNRAQKGAGGRIRGAKIHLMIRPPDRTNMGVCTTRGIFLGSSRLTYKEGYNSIL